MPGGAIIQRSHIQARFFLVPFMMAIPIIVVLKLLILLAISGFVPEMLVLVCIRRFGYHSRYILMSFSIIDLLAMQCSRQMKALLTIVFLLLVGLCLGKTAIFEVRIVTNPWIWSLSGCNVRKSRLLLSREGAKSLEETKVGME